MPTPAVFPAQANMVDSITETYGYLTDVLRAYDGHEQRISLRRHPVGSLEFTFLCDNVRDCSVVDAALYINQPMVWAVPLWQYAEPLTAQATAGTNALVVASTVNIPFTDPLSLGRYVVVWQKPTAFELCELLDVAAGQVNVVQPLDGTWIAARSYVVPVRMGRLDQVVATRWLTPSVFTGRLRFTFDATADPGSMVQYVLMGGGPVPTPGG